MLCEGFTIPNFNPKKDTFFVMLHFTCTCIKFLIKSIQNKRAMMALDRSPESLSPQMNSTSLFLWFQLVIPSFDPKGHHKNKIDKGLQGDTTHQKI